MLTDIGSASHSGSFIRKQLLIVLLSFVEQHAVPVFEEAKVKQVIERALLLAPDCGSVGE
ncbi:hypothetical protein KIN20_020164 [Parelaphostrongylus tenuis]|uniref:Uncharacterized protein n=1 Tax=Parelaphostrongylus tenuis TaxID=148309 RepID=A0AAD5QT18_PARTN|nr:hypothetical protein KIN20_020164 [Parelaphostrongylus tenuis]